TMRNFTCLTIAWFLVAAHAHAAEAPDLAKIDRKIKKQPAYTAKQPLFGLYVFGPEAKTHVWAVLDKSDAPNQQYHVLYFDRCGDRDLTDDGERIDGNDSFSIGDFSDPDSGDTHTSLVLTRRADQEGSVMLRLNWKGREPMRGGFAEAAGPYTQFASDVA